MLKNEIKNPEARILSLNDLKFVKEHPKIDKAGNKSIPRGNLLIMNDDNDFEKVPTMNIC